MKIIFLILSLFLIACSNSDEDFKTFYTKFHQDSLFQTSRIKFPLKGIYKDGFRKENWTKENWNMLKTPIQEVDTLQFKTSLYQTENEFYEKIWIENSGFSIEYKFKKIDGKWFLIYANELNL